MQPRLHLTTLIAIAIVVYAIANVAHEGLGHGGACAALGGDPQILDATYFECDSAALSSGGRRVISAAGTLMNLAVAAISFLALAATAARGATAGRYFLWLLGLVNLLQGTGYWMFSGIAGIGDWTAVVRGLEPMALYRIGLAVVGTAAYLLAIGAGLRAMLPFLGAGPERKHWAVRLTVVPYLAGGALYLAAGLLNPESLLLVLISAAAASFGGTSALAWMAQLLDSERRFPASSAPPLDLPASRGWIAVGVATAALFVGVLGPSPSSESVAPRLARAASFCSIQSARIAARPGRSPRSLVACSLPASSSSSAVLLCSRTAATTSVRWRSWRDTTSRNGSPGRSIEAIDSSLREPGAMSRR